LSFPEQFSSPSEKHELACLKANGTLSLLINSVASIPFADWSILINFVLEKVTLYSSSSVLQVWTFNFVVNGLKLNYQYKDRYFAAEQYGCK